MYQSRNRIPVPWVSITVVKGTLRKAWQRTAPEVKMKRGGKPADKRLPKAMTSPHAKAVNGANSGPTDAIPSVANRDALKYPPIPKASYITTASRVMTYPVSLDRVYGVRPRPNLRLDL
jgi:hypothetical protein